MLSATGPGDAARRVTAELGKKAAEIAMFERRRITPAGDAALRHLSPGLDTAETIAWGTKPWSATSRFFA